VQAQSGSRHCVPHIGIPFSEAYAIRRRPAPLPRPRTATATPTATATATPGTVPTTLICSGPPGTVEPPGTSISATLSDASGPLASRQIQWSDEPGLGFFAVGSSLTNESGVATNDYVVPFDAGFEGDETVTAMFLGDAGSSPSSCQVTFHVVSPPFPTPTLTPTPCPGCTPTPVPVAGHDARLFRIGGVPKNVRLSPGEVITDNASIVVANDSDHAETIGAYVEVRHSSPGCTPNGRVLQTTVALAAGKRVTLPVPVSYSCSDPSAADGLSYSWIAVADHGADDLSSCGPASLQV
jgi:hypothetical protein